MATKGATQIAHLFEDQRWVVEGAASGIRVIAAFVINLLVVGHHHLLVLSNVVHWSNHWLDYLRNRCLSRVG